MIQHFIPFRIIINILGIYFCRFLRFIQISTGNLPAGQHQFTTGTIRKQMTCLVCDIKLEIIQRFSDGHIRIILVHFKYGGKDRCLCRSIGIEQLIIFGRLAGNKLFSSYRKILQTLAIHFQRELSSDLCRHKGMCDPVFFKVLLKSDKIQTDLFRNNMKLCSVGDRSIDIHHGGIKTKRRIGRYFAVGIYTVIFSVPMAECCYISIFQHTSLRHTCRA